MNFKITALTCFAGALILIPFIPFARELIFTVTVLGLASVYFVFRWWTE